METEIRKYFTRVIEDLQKNATSYSVFHAIFVCERMINKLYPDRDQDKLDQKEFQFRPYENYVFPPSNIRKIHYQNDVISFVINFLGLYGINSPLPRCYHDQVALQQSIHGAGQVPLQNFLDVFNNRFYWLYYQAWKKYRYYLNLNDDPDNKVMQQVFSFTGQGPKL